MLVLLIAVSGMVLKQGPLVRASAISGTAHQLSVQAAQQIQSLEDEKESRTPAQQKNDSQLIYAGKMHRGEDVASGIRTLDVDVSLMVKEWWSLI
ncbi:MAG: hypothetical protein M3R68_08275 [Acidobacteriota bacterium]|nr:hypothetical protein [Acidobacteriota bacterium]